MRGVAVFHFGNGFADVQTWLRGRFDFDVGEDFYGGVVPARRELDEIARLGLFRFMLEFILIRRGEFRAVSGRLPALRRFEADGRDRFVRVGYGDFEQENAVARHSE